MQAGLAAVLRAQLHASPSPAETHLNVVVIPPTQNSVVNMSEESQRSRGMLAETTLNKTTCKWQARHSFSEKQANIQPSHIQPGEATGAAGRLVALQQPVFIRGKMFFTHPMSPPSSS